MRRSEREIIDPNELKEIVQKADVCRIAFSADGAPYIVTLNFGFKWEGHLTLYFHSAKEGKKIDMLKKNNLVCFEMDIEHEMTKEAKPCGWGMKYRSVVGVGNIGIVEDPHEKKKALDLIMEHYGYEGRKEYDETSFNKTEILKLDVKGMIGKKKS